MSDSEPLVSILCPAYNAERWIGAAMDSVVGQTWRRKEVIVVDDGSRDRTLDVLKKYESPNFLVKKQSNAGASAARNHCLKWAQGDFIQWMDADDILDRQKIERQIDRWRRLDHDNELLFSGPWGRFYQETEKADFQPDSLWASLSVGDWLFNKLRDNAWAPPEVWLVSRAITEKAGDWDETLKRDNDGEYLCRVLLASKRTEFVEDAKIYYRQAVGGSVSADNNMSESKLDSLVKSCSLYVDRLLSVRDDDDAKKVGLEFLQRWYHFFYPDQPERMAVFQTKADLLGGQLKPPKFSGTSEIVRRLFGSRVAKKFYFNRPRIGAWLARAKESVRG